MVDHGVEFDLSCHLILMHDFSGKVLLLGLVCEEVLLVHDQRPHDVILVDHLDCYSGNRRRTDEGEVFVLPDWLSCLGVRALLGLEYFLADCHPHAAVHIPKRPRASLELSSFEPQVDDIHCFLPETGRKHDEPSLLPIVVQEAPQRNGLGLLLYLLARRRLWAFDLEGTEVGVEVDDAVANRTIGASSVAVEQFYFQAPSVELVAAVDDELEDVGELGVLASLLDD